jgi:beta-galactosidase
MALLLAWPAVAASLIPADEGCVRSLDGRWRFRLEQPGDTPEHGSIGGRPRDIVTPDRPEPFEAAGYREDDSWHDLAVPGNWEMAGFSLATFNQPDNAIGLYRLSFTVPAGWRDRLVKIQFDGVQNGAEVYCNGRPVNVDEPSWGRPNYHESGNTAFQADITPVVRVGGDNLLAVRVTKNTRSVDLDTGDFFFLGGIHRSVTLFSVPRLHVQEMAVRTKVLANGMAEVRLLLGLSAPAAGARLAMQLGDAPPVEGPVDAQGRAELIQVVERPGLWSAEKPNLYALRVDLKDERGRVIEQVRRRVGIREVTIEDGILMVNHVPVKLAGMCRHEVYPTLGTALNEEVWRKDITLMKAANVNAIRTSHYPYGAGFYDLCDELGMYVADEVSAGWCPTDTEELSPAFAQRARETVRRDRNHPCVILWAIGNENKPGRNNKVAAEEIRRLDPTRPRLVSWRKAEHAGVELDDLHYTDPADVARANRDTERRRTYPITYLENPNDWEIRNGADFGCTDRWVAVLDRTWREVWEADHIPGSFLWEWQDRAVADPCRTKLYDYEPATGIHYVKAKGICDGFRNPRPWYYHVKMVYAPIRVAAIPRVAGSSVVLAADNRYSFTDLAELNTTWRLMSGGRELQRGLVHPALAPRTCGEIRLDLPSEALAGADTLQVDFDHPDGRNVVTCRMALRDQPDRGPRIDAGRLEGIRFPAFNLTAVTYGPKPTTGWRMAFRHPGRLAGITVRRATGALAAAPVSDEAALSAMALADVRAMDADVFLEDDPARAIVGHVRVDQANGHFSYRINWTGERADIQELGWIFELPKECDRFSWDRKAYWSYYPDTHIGRPAGTARPDSADANITRLSRPDAFDFNSTKYDCNWATLARESGHGLAVRFEPDARHHCRAGTTQQGGHRLVVNRLCCPPRDLSSGVVPDYNVVLERGTQAEGRFRLGTIGTR